MARRSESIDLRHGLFFGLSKPTGSRKINLTMNRSISILTSAALSLFLIGGLVSCSKKANPAGVQVKQPFSGNKFESNAAWFRGKGQGASVKQNIARSKADLDAKNQLAGQVNTNLSAVVDQYLGQTENANAAEVADKFQSLVRETMSTEVADMRKIGEETYLNETTKEYTVYVAYEIKKNAMFRFMKKQAKADDKIDAITQKKLDEILDKEIEKADAAGE